MVSRGGKEGGRWGGEYISPSRSYCLGKTLAPSMTTPKTKGKELIPSLSPTLCPNLSRVDAECVGVAVKKPHQWQEQTTEEGEGGQCPPQALSRLKPAQEEPGMERSENGCSSTLALSGMGPVESQQSRDSLRRSSGNREVEGRGPQPPLPGESGFEEGLRKGVFSVGKPRGEVGGSPRTLDLSVLSP